MVPSLGNTICILHFQHISILCGYWTVKIYIILSVQGIQSSFYVVVFSTCLTMTNNNSSSFKKFLPSPSSRRCSIYLQISLKISLNKRLQRQSFAKSFRNARGSCEKLYPLTEFSLLVHAEDRATRVTGPLRSIYLEYN